MTRTFWVDKLGRLRRVSSMKTKHLINAIEMFDSNGNFDDIIAEMKSELKYRKQSLIDKIFYMMGLVRT